MRKIQLQTIYTTDTGGYEVPLGNGTIHVFKNAKAAKSFVAQTNQFLTEQCFRLAKLYAELQYKYRTEFWHTFNMAGCTEVERALGIAEHTLKFAYVQAPMKSGHILTFTNIKKTLSALSKTITVFKAYDKGNSHTTNLYTFKSWQESINDVGNSVRNYGTTVATDVVAPEHVDFSAYKNRPTITGLKFDVHINPDLEADAV